MLNIPVSGMGSRAGFETRRVPTFRRYGRQFGSSKEVQVIPIDPLPSWNFWITLAGSNVFRACQSFSTTGRRMRA